MASIKEENPLPQSESGELTASNDRKTGGTAISPVGNEESSRVSKESSSSHSKEFPAESPSPLCPTSCPTKPASLSSSLRVAREDPRVHQAETLDDDRNDFFEMENENAEDDGILSWNASFFLSSIQEMIPEKQVYEDPATPLFFPSARHHKFFDGDENVIEEKQRISQAKLAASLKSTIPSGRTTSSSMQSIGKAVPVDRNPSDLSLLLDADDVVLTSSGSKSTLPSPAKLQEDSGEAKEDDSTTPTHVRIVNSIAFPPLGARVEKQKNLLFWGHALPLYSIVDVPHWQRYNTAIRGSYRAFYDTKMTFKSLVGWHNESMNVWTHLAGFLFFIYLTYFLFANVIQENGSFSIYLYDAPIFYYVFCLGCLSCTICSTIYHLFSGHRDGKLISLMGRVDFIGITLLIISSLLPPVYVMLHCIPFYRNIYISVTILLGIFTSIACWTDIFYHHVFLRVGLFIGLAMSGACPLVHSMLVMPYTSSINSVLCGLLLMAVLYLTGVVFYVVRFPEAWFPSHFDCFFSSHQIWHYFVLLAALVHFCNCTSMYQIYTMSEGNC